jgi:hypothetical protein
VTNALTVATIAVFVALVAAARATATFTGVGSVASDDTVLTAATIAVFVALICRLDVRRSESCCWRFCVYAAVREYSESCDVLSARNWLKTSGCFSLPYPIYMEWETGFGASMVRMRDGRSTRCCQTPGLLRSVSAFWHQRLHGHKRVGRRSRHATQLHFFYTREAFLTRSDHR